MNRKHILIVVWSVLVMPWACGREAKAPQSSPPPGTVIEPTAPIRPPAPGLKGASLGPPAHEHGPSREDHAGQDHAGHDHAGHDSAFPPIDCPLRQAHGQEQAGHGTGGQHKPFSDNAEYIRFLDREDRAAWQKPDEVVAALKLAGDAGQSSSNFGD